MGVHICIFHICGALSFAVGCRFYIPVGPFFPFILQLLQLKHPVLMHVLQSPPPTPLPFVVYWWQTSPSLLQCRESHPSTPSSHHLRATVALTLLVLDVQQVYECKNLFLPHQNTPSCPFCTFSPLKRKTKTPPFLRLPLCFCVAPISQAHL